MRLVQVFPKTPTWRASRVQEGPGRSGRYDGPTLGTDSSAHAGQHLELSTTDLVGSHRLGAGLSCIGVRLAAPDAAGPRNLPTD